MSGEAPRNVTADDVQKVHNLIESCLKQYMTKKEVIDALHREAGIPTQVTELVWQKLEDENPAFFKAYNVNLIVIRHIVAFNDLLAKQLEKMHEHFPTTNVPVPFSNGSNASSVPGMLYLAEATLRPDYTNGLGSNIMNEISSSNSEYPFYGNSILHEQSGIREAQIQPYFGEVNQDIRGQLIDSGSTFGSLDQMTPNFNGINYADRLALGMEESFGNMSLPSGPNYSETTRRE